MNLRTKTIVIFLLASIPAIATVGVINYENAQTQITHDVLERLDGIATIQEKRVEETIERNFERLQGITSRTQLRMSLEQFNQNGSPDDAAKIGNIITDAKESISDIESIFIISPAGSVIFSTDAQLLGEDYSSEEVFVKGLNEKTLMLDRNNLDYSITMCISGPLILDGEHLGVLVLKVSPRTILDISSDYTSLGETGETFMAKRFGGDALFITPLRFDPNAMLSRVIPKENTQIPITQALLTNEITLTDALDYRGESVLAATRYVESADWGMVVKMDRAEAFATINNIRDLTLVTMAIVVILTVGGALFFSKTLTKRIKKLSEATHDISHGGTKTQSIQDDDEIGQLSKDIRKMEETLRENEQRLLADTRFAAIGEISSRIAHDLRNPLSVVKNSLELMEYGKRDSLTEHEKRQFSMINRAIGRMERQITEVLDFVRNREVIREECDLLDVINLSVSSFDIPPDVRITLPTEGAKIHVDVTQIQVVFSNLIQNALHAVGQEGEIIIRLTKRPDQFLIEIEDSGKGIPKEQIDKIFEPLFTTKQKGTGLGLASCKNIIERHGGTISVKNNPTTFTVSLPLGIPMTEKSTT